MAKAQETGKQKGKKKGKGFRFIRRFILAILIILVVLIGGLLALFYTTDPQMLVDSISHQIYEQYGRQLKIETVQLSLLKGIELKGISISERGGFPRGKSLEFSEGSVIYNPVALLWRELDIVKISVGGFYTTYDNLNRLIEDFTKEVSKPKVQETKPPKTDQKAFFRFRIRSVEVYNSRFSYNNVLLEIKASLAPQAEWEMSRIDAQVWSDYGTLKFLGTVKEMLITVRDLEVAKFVPGMDKLKVNQLQVVFTKVDENTLSLNGKIVDIDFADFRITAFSQFTGSYGIRGKSVLVRDLGLNINSSRIMVPRLAYRIPSQSLDATISDINAQLGDFVKGASGTVSGKLDVVYNRSILLSGNLGVTNLHWGPVQRASASLNFDHNRVDGALALQTAGGMVYADVNSENLAQSVIALNIRSDKLDISALVKEFGKKGGEAPPEQDAGTKTESSSDTKLPIGPLQLNLVVNTATYDKFTFNNLRASASYANTILTLNNLSLEFIRGQLTASGKLINNILSGELIFTGGKLKDFSQAFFEEPKRLYGTVDANAKFRLPMNDMLSAIAQLNVEIKSGEIRNFIIQNEISQVLYNMPLDDIFFDLITVNATMQDNILNLLEFKFDSDSIRVNATGDLNVKSKALSVNALASFSDDFISGLPNVARLYTSGFRDGDRVNFKLEIGGMLEKPKVQLKK